MLGCDLHCWPYYLRTLNWYLQAIKLSCGGVLRWWNHDWPVHGNSARSKISHCCLLRRWHNLRHIDREDLKRMVHCHRRAGKRSRDHQVRETNIFTQNIRIWLNNRLLVTDVLRINRDDLLRRIFRVRRLRMWPRWRDGHFVAWSYLWQIFGQLVVQGRGLKRFFHDHVWLVQPEQRENVNGSRNQQVAEQGLPHGCPSDGAMDQRIGPICRRSRGHPHRGWISPECVSDIAQKHPQPRLVLDHKPKAVRRSPGWLTRSCFRGQMHFA